MSLSARRARQLFTLHRWTGLLTGLFILFLSLTGAALVFITEIDRALNREILKSEPAGPPIVPERALAAVARAHPEARVSRIEMPKDDRGVYVVHTGRVQEPVRYNQVMVDPYTEQVLGTRDYQQSLAFVLRQLHLRFFYFGWKGRVVVGVFGLVLLFSCITGLLIYGRFIRALPRWWSIRRGRGLQISSSDWHKLVGITALAFNLVIAFTGAVLGLENLARYSPAVSQAIHPKAPEAGRPPPPATVEGAIPVSRAVELASRAIPGLVVTSATLPREERSHWVVTGNLRGRIEMEGASTVHLHTHTGEVIYRHDSRRARTITKAYNWMDPLHFGYWAGVWSQILYLVFGLTTAFLSITGFMLWYLKTWRRPRRESRPVRSLEVVT